MTAPVTLERVENIAGWVVSGMLRLAEPAHKEMVRDLADLVDFARQALADRPVLLGIDAASDAPDDFKEWAVEVNRALIAAPSEHREPLDFCVACEGHPKPPNVPCAICGAEAERREPTREAIAEAFRPITMQDVRLHVGEGKLTSVGVLAGVNAELTGRQWRLLALFRGEG